MMRSIATKGLLELFGERRRILQSSQDVDASSDCDVAYRICKLRALIFDELPELFDCFIEFHGIRVSAIRASSWRKMSSYNQSSRSA
jgi:hypothetical protein